MRKAERSKNLIIAETSNLIPKFKTFQTMNLLSKSMRTKIESKDIIKIEKGSSDSQSQSDIVSFKSYKINIKSEIHLSGMLIRVIKDARFFSNT